MSSRLTNIVDCEIVDFDELRDELFDELSTALVDEKRLMKRFYDFCEDYNNFEFDEMGINMNEADEVLRKADKIRSRFLTNIEDKLFCSFSNVETTVLIQSISMNLTSKDINYKVTIKVMADSFSLEVL